MNITQLIKIKQDKLDILELACGNCKSTLYGYDEVICPVCGFIVDVDDTILLTENEFTERCFPKLH